MVCWPEPEPERATDERGRHGADLIVKDGVQRVCTGVMALRSSGKVGDAEVVASERWYRDFALAIHGAKDADRTRCRITSDAR
jgi:hypothetical protein